MPDRNRPIGVVLLPDTHTDLYVRGLSHALAPLGSKIVLGGASSSGIVYPPYPHVSLYHLMANPDELPLMVEAILTQAGHNRQPLCEIAATKLTIVNGWCFLKSHLMEWLCRFQRNVLTACEPYRRGTILFSWQDRFTPEQQTNYKRWGYPNIADAWDLHFTYGLLPPEILADTLIPTCVRWTPTRLALVALGDHGTAAKILHEIPAENF